MTDKMTLDPLVFDWDGWIASAERPTATVELHPGDTALDEQMSALEAKLDALVSAAEQAERTTAENRGIADLSPEVIAAQAESARDELADLTRQWNSKARTFHLTQLTDREIVDVRAKAEAAGVDRKDDAEHTLWILAESITSPPTTADNLRRLRDRDRSGAAMVTALSLGAGKLLQVDAPFSRPSSSAPS